MSNYFEIPAQSEEAGSSRRMFQWTPDYAVNVPEIDREHQKWFGLIYSLHQAMRDGKGKETLGPLFANATAYTLAHFSHEEALMTRVHYPELAAHAKEHEDLRRTVQEFKERFDRGEATITIELMEFLWHWLQRHTITIDRRIGEYLNASGEAPDGVRVQRI